MVKEPLSLYFHLPFCTRKCPYCHFYVIPNNKAQQQSLLDALLLEWNLRLKQIRSHEIVSIYFGGGTPTLFGVDNISTLLKQIQSDALISPECEITLEANPEDVALPLMEGFKNADINRVSIGVQSLQDQELHTLERTHNAQQAIDAIHTTVSAGIENISIDLMYELPNQTSQRFASTLSQLEGLPITHLSLYNLTIEPNTPFFKRTLNLPTQEEGLRMLQLATEHLGALGLQRYEISAFAKPGYISKHNTGYWTGRLFFGLGPSAFSYYEGVRFRNVANLHRYTRMLQSNAFPIDFEEKLTYPKDVHELLAVKLRMLEGADLKQYNLPPSTHFLMDRLVDDGLLERIDEKIRLSEKGKLFYDTVAAEIV